MNIYNDIKDIIEGKADEYQLYIYVLENYPQKNIKIGRTTNPLHRFRSLMGSNNGGNTISRIAVSPMTYLYSIEKTCHTHFHYKRIKGTEYFKDITFEEAVDYVDSLFNSSGYEKCNKIRKDFYAQNINNVPGFLIRNDDNYKIVED